MLHLTSFATVVYCPYFHIKKFSDFAKFVDANAGDYVGKKVLMYCTGDQQNVLSMIDH